MVPGHTWGRLPQQMIVLWGEKHCDMVFTLDRIRRRPLSSCNDSSNLVDSSLPHVAILAASTSRSIDHPSLKNIALFHVMLPTLARTLDCGFRYTYFLAYDIGDAFYDTSKVCHGLLTQVPALIVAYKSYRASVKSWIGLRRTLSSL